MSDHWITLIPEDPRFVPKPVNQLRAQERFSEAAPNADDITIRYAVGIEFHDCGTNFECVRCPTCGAEIPIEWWSERMDEDYEEGFRLAAYTTPCCNANHALHELVYEWPQGFSRFAIEAINPGIGELDGGVKNELETILGTKLRVIYRHL